MRWWVGLKNDSIVIVYASRKPTYLTKVSRGYALLSTLVNETELFQYPMLVANLKSSI